MQWNVAIYDDSNIEAGVLRIYYLFIVVWMNAKCSRNDTTQYRHLIGVNAQIYSEALVGERDAQSFCMILNILNVIRWSVYIDYRVCYVEHSIAIIWIQCIHHFFQHH